MGMSKAGWKEVEEREVLGSSGQECEPGGWDLGTGQWLQGTATLVFLPNPDRVLPWSSLAALSIKLFCLPEYIWTPFSP